MDDPSLRPVLDSHVHVWDANAALAPDRRYTPTGQARVDELLRMLDANAMDGAVLVQPSFLGTDNRYLLAALQVRPDRFRGIAVVDALAGAPQLEGMKAMGVIGIRFNLIGTSPRMLEVGPVREVVETAAALGLWIEVQAESADWQTVLAAIGDAPLMVDHFGRPTGPDCPGLARLLDRAPARTCVKFSAPYRVPAPDLAPIARAWLDHLGPERCLWGSDWPWTQHEGRHGYPDTVRWLADWASTEECRAMREAAPLTLGFRKPH